MQIPDGRENEPAAVSFVIVSGEATVSSRGVVINELHAGDLCGEMAVAYFHTHFPRGRWPILNGGELAVLYCFFFLYLFAAGPGPLSLDRLVRRK